MILFFSRRFSLVSLLIIMLLIGCATSDDAFQRAAAEDTIYAYEFFIKYHPNSEFAPEARQRITELKQIRAAAEQKAWEEVVKADTPDGYASFLHTYPRSQMVGRAKIAAQRTLKDQVLKTWGIDKADVMQDNAFPNTNFDFESIVKTMEPLPLGYYICCKTSPGWFEDMGNKKMEYIGWASFHADRSRQLASCGNAEISYFVKIQSELELKSRDDRLSATFYSYPDKLIAAMHLQFSFGKETNRELEISGSGIVLIKDSEGVKTAYEFFAKD